MPRHRRYTKVWAAQRSCGGLRNLNDGKEKTELTDGVSKTLVIHRLRDVDVATQLVATFDFLRVVGRRKHDHRRTFKILVVFDAPEDVDPGHVRQIEIKQDQHGLPLVGYRAAVRSEEIVNGSCTVGERNDLIVDTGAPNIPLNQTCVAFVVLDHDDGDWIGHESLFRLLAVHLAGSVIVNVLPL